MTNIGMSMTFGQKLALNKGFGPGFDFCRVALALSIVVFHSFTILGHEGLEYKPFIWLYNIAVLPMFFGLSGFLVAGSAHRQDLKNFLINRGVRIAPALTVEIVLSALVLGTLLTVFPLSRYFSDELFFRYFLNIFGIIHYQLPGVFTENPRDIVNGSLWTVPLEIGCYVLISLLIFTKTVNKWWAVLGLAAAWTFAGFYYNNQTIEKGSFIANFQLLHMMLDGFFAQRGPGLIPCFLVGILAYNYKDKIPHRPFLVVACLAILLVIATIGNFEWIKSPLFVAITTPLFVYLVIYVGLTEIPKLPFYSTGDYSYGIYLYGYPLQQTIVHFFPSVNVIGLMLSSMVFISLFATFSWHCIEKPILTARKNFATKAREKEAALKQTEN